MLNNTSGMLCKHLLSGGVLVATGVSAVMEINLILKLLAGEYSLLSIDDNDEIAGVNMRGEGRFIFAAQNHCNLAGETADGLTLSVYNIPLALDILCIGHECRFHA